MSTGYVATRSHAFSGNFRGYLKTHSFTSYYTELVSYTVEEWI
jgi:hypothetical protein